MLIPLVISLATPGVLLDIYIGWSKTTPTQSVPFSPLNKLEFRDLPVQQQLAFQGGVRYIHEEAILVVGPLALWVCAVGINRLAVREYFFNRIRFAGSKCVGKRFDGGVKACQAILKTFGQFSLVFLCI